MRAVLASIVFALGCSSGDFTVDSTAADAPASDTSESADTATDTAVDSAADSASETDSVVEVGCTHNSECGAEQWCKRSSCTDAMGTCASLSKSSTYAPVCGCDGVTYWNARYAESYAQPHHDGVCPPSDAKTCMGASCDGGDGYCAKEVETALGCAKTSIVGHCVRMPKGIVCGTPGNSGPSVNDCTMKCVSLCEAIQNDKVYFTKICTPG